MNNRTNLRKNIKEITLIIAGKDATYKRERIIQDDFKLQKEDFK